MTLSWYLLFVWAWAPLATVTADHDISRVCKALARTLPDFVAFPDTPAYEAHNAYWSARQSELRPACFVAPISAQDVARAVRVLTKRGARFTVKAGGHTAFDGGSNIDAPGVTLDLAGLDGISVSADRRTVSVGAGNRWINVSEVLDPLGLAVVGGRVSTVGVSGLTLGGGISYFSGMWGWACDNVRNYEVVLASGELVNASPTVNADLFWALRGGGGSNFGIVTRFDLVSFEQGELWASTLVYPGTVTETLIPLVHDLLVRELPAVPAAHTFFVMAYVAALGGYLTLSDQFHARYSDILHPPAVFAPFHNITLPKLFVYTRLSTVSRLSLDIEQPGGMRQAWWETTVAATETPDLLLDIFSMWQDFVERLLETAAADDFTVTPFLIFHPISLNVLDAMQVNGGNALGLEPEDGPIMIVQMNVLWTSAALDDTIQDGLRDLVASVETLAASRGARPKNGYIYMNYADKSQDVYAGYGEENLARLRSVARRYDPEGQFRRLWRGYFKL
ncbi:hypothetical protein P885DRAFT_77441 [Corynascus similis CBS 632.67]